LTIIAIMELPMNGDGGGSQEGGLEGGSLGGIDGTTIAQIGCLDYSLANERIVLIIGGVPPTGTCRDCDGGRCQEDDDRRRGAICTMRSVSNSDILHRDSDSRVGRVGEGDVEATHERCTGSEFEGAFHGTRDLNYRAFTVGKIADSVRIINMANLLPMIVAR